MISYRAGILTLTCDTCGFMSKQSVPQDEIPHSINFAKASGWHIVENPVYNKLYGRPYHHYCTGDCLPPESPASGKEDTLRE